MIISFITLNLGMITQKISAPALFPNGFKINSSSLFLSIINGTTDPKPNTQVLTPGVSLGFSLFFISNSPISTVNSVSKIDLTSYASPVSQLVLSL